MSHTSSPEPFVSVSLTVKRGADALDFYTRAFGAKELYRMSMPDGGVAHAEFMIGSTRIMLSDEAPAWHAYAMPEGASASCLFSIHVEDCDAALAVALAAGAEPLMPPADQFWGARNAMVRDPFGYRWSLLQKLEDVAPEEIMRRARALFG